ncbi:MAG: metal ABC transporter permease [Ardenticatenaceae bacterium]|nr:metal ABC transporter permease [Ardenticatenaceae bacterium]
MDFLQLLFTDYTVRTVALGAAVLGMASGSLGTFAMLRRQSLLGDAMSHAALPGVILAFMLTGSKSPLVLVIGAAIAGVIGTLFMLAITRYTKIKEDSALGIVLSVFFGFGLVLLTFLQRNPDARQAGLNTFLFGQAATMLVRDIVTMVVLGGIALVILILYWKEFKLLSFDRDFGASLGYPMTYLDILLTSLLVIAIVIGLQAVGVVLMSAMIVAPAAAARQWTNRLGLMTGMSAVFGAIAGVSGSLISSLQSGFSTGPVVVLVISGIVIFSLLFAGNRGIIWSWIRQQRRRRILRLETVLSNMFKLAEQHEDLTHPHSRLVLRAMDHGRGGVEASLKALEEQGWVKRIEGDQWSLTPAGIEEARQFARQS